MQFGAQKAERMESRVCLVNHKTFSDQPKEVMYAHCLVVKLQLRYPYLG